MNNIAKLKRLFALAGGAICLWGVLGFMQLESRGQPGYETRWGAEVARVEHGGPADVAGLREGDLILRVGGAAVKNPWLPPSHGRVGVGGVQPLQIERQGQTKIVNITWEPLSADHWRALFVDGFITLAFLGFGLWAFLLAGTRASLLLAAFGLCYAAANLEGPGLGHPDGLVAFVQANLSLFYTALLCYFLILFPKRKGMFRRPIARWILFAPFLIFLAFGCVVWLSSPALLDAYAAAAMFVDISYSLIALAALIHSWFELSRRERRESGFYWIPIGLVIAIGPFILLGLIGVAIPGFEPPGQHYLPLLGVAIPAGLAVAAVTGARSACHETAQQRA